MLELVSTGANLRSQRLEIIDTVATVFNITGQEYGVIKDYVLAETPYDLDYANVLVAGEAAKPRPTSQKHTHLPIEGQLVFMRVQSVDLYFARYLGDEVNHLNGFTMAPNRVYLYPPGSTIKTPAGSGLYYSDIIAHFNEKIRTTQLSFHARIDEFKFPNGVTGLRNVNIAEGPGKLIGIMGASGSGKTTLLNVLAGVEKPSDGEIEINGIDIHGQKDQIHGVIGYVPQDDLLVEELTVYQNLYFNARLCFSGLTTDELHERVMDVLKSLGLDHRKDLRVGNALEKTISGGQRKRLNIALELIREPAILFLDEPTSGLSSRDSENVIDLLKELSLRGKLIFVVIHQPSSDVYKLFDKMIIMDVGGYPVYYGAPVDGVIYFKKAAHQVDSSRGQCEACGNVNPEQIFNIIEARVVDEYGQATAKRKVTPKEWHAMFNLLPVQRSKPVNEEPPRSLHLPGRLKQILIFATRDLLTKVSNKQYLLINILQAPVLAALLAFVIRYKNSPDSSTYSFRFNDNIPAYLLMSIIVALFMGLTVSAEEIIRDRKLLKRESFLNLSRNSYLLSKITILFTLSALQTLLFVFVGNAILGVQGMTVGFWIILFSTSCFANVLGLNISDTFNSAVTVYILIPLLLIPQMVFSGTMFSYDKLNEYISTKGRVPVIADLMASRWAYEGMAVHQFMNNEYQKPFFEYEKNKSVADYKSAHLADELTARANYVLNNLGSTDQAVISTCKRYLISLQFALLHEPFRNGIEDMDVNRELNYATVSRETLEVVAAYLESYKAHYQEVYNYNTTVQEMKISFYASQGWDQNHYSNFYFNESLSNLVRNVTTIDRFTEHNGELRKTSIQSISTCSPKSEQI